MTATVTAVQDSAWPPRIIVDTSNITDLVTDTFARTSASSWGVADSGQTWATSGGSVTDFNVTSGAATQKLSTTVTVRNAHLSADEAVDVNVFTSMKFSATPVGASAVCTLAGRYVDFNNQYQLTCTINTGTSMQVALVKRVAGTPTTIASTVTIAATFATTKTYGLRLVIVGSTISGTAWDMAGAEPAAQVTATDTDITAAGDAGIQTNVTTGNTNTNPTFTFTGFQVDFGLPMIVGVSRIQSGVRTLLRGARGVHVNDTAFVVFDGEYSFGIPTTYVLNVDGTDLATSSPITPTLPGGNVALSDAITGLAAECIITAWPDRTTDRGAAKFNVGGRTVVVAPPRGGFESSVEFMTMTEADRDAMNALLDGAASGIILCRAPDATVYPGFDFHLAVLTDDERIFVQSGTDPRRLWTLDVVESAGWAPSLSSFGWTWDDVADAYTGLTWNDVPTDFATWEDFEVFDWGLGL